MLRCPPRGAVKNSLCAAENRPAYYTLSEARLSSTALDAACKELQIEPVLTDGRLSESQAPLPLRAPAHLQEGRCDPAQGTSRSGGDVA